MTDEVLQPAAAFAALGIDPRLCAVLAGRGFEQPTDVQSAMLGRDLGTRDVLISARTGSGKTVAFGLLLAKAFAENAPQRTYGACTPRAIVIAPTRELAQQVREELAWLLQPLGVRTVAVTGGTSVGGERRDLAGGADVIVGTPGRLNDHLRSNAIDPSKLHTVTLDEADEMLDMGFRDELEAILDVLPKERRTIMLSATLPSEIVAMARRYQTDAVRIAVEVPGSAHSDITHVCHLVPLSQKHDALVNVLLTSPEERSLVFTRTRAEASETAATLVSLGFAAAALTGEMVQRERTRTLDAFRAGQVHILVATDVAARGLDVPEVTRVVHLDLPGDGSVLTHRSGRTGRAGRKGTSVLVVPAIARVKAQALLRAARVQAQWLPVPDASSLRAAAEERLVEKLGTDSKGDAGQAGLAARLLEKHDAVALVARLLGEIKWDGPCAPRRVSALNASESNKRPERNARPWESNDRPAYDRPRDGAPVLAPRGDRPSWNADAPRPAWNADAPRADRRTDAPAFAPREREREGGRGGEGYAMFRVNFGEKHGATPARLLAMVCRRGNVQGRDVGAITIRPNGSTFGVAPEVAASFSMTATQPDMRDPQVSIERVLHTDAPGADGPSSLASAPPPRYRPAGAPARKRPWSS